MGDVHALKLSAAAFGTNEHDDVAVSVVENAKTGEVSRVSAVGAVCTVTTGRVASTVKVRDTGAPTLPAASLALTWKVYVPSVSAVYDVALEHAVKVGLLGASAHSKVAVVSAEEKAKEASLAPTSPLGPLSMPAPGLTVSTLKLTERASPRLPAWSRACTRNTYEPSESGPYVSPVSHGLAEPPGASEQTNEAPVSAELNPKEGVVTLLTASGWLVMLGATGATVSMVRSVLALPTLPAASVPLTVNR
jgi:hypothetical protein